jgi:putative DNA primase/helicase
MVLPETYKGEVCKGFDAKAVTRVLLARGWIESGSDGKATQKPRLPGLPPTRCYVLGPRMWEDEQ